MIFATLSREPLATRRSTLAYWLPEFGSWSDFEGRLSSCRPRSSGRATTMIDRDGAARGGTRSRSRALHDEPELLDAVTAAAGIAIENGRLHVELRARLEELRDRGRA